ncbi:MAG: HD domain-containing protein [Oscillospiraceae bacterium]|nr:HD domain-containing protein [Oscillospiraceae bacterium]
MKAKLVRKMIDCSAGNTADIAHFLKVLAYAETIGALEHLDAETQLTLELAAVVHDIACPFCREKYGHCGGKEQEIESEALLRPFLAEFELPQAMLERIIHLVTHHHTVTDVDGIDYRILLEADFLVNAAEMQLRRDAVEAARKRFFRTESGTRLLDSIFLRA